MVCRANNAVAPWSDGTWRLVVKKGTAIVEEARVEIDRQLIALPAENGGRMPLVHDVRFFLYPHASHRLVLAFAERAAAVPTLKCCSSYRPRRR